MRKVFFFSGTAALLMVIILAASCRPGEQPPASSQEKPAPAKGTPAPGHPETSDAVRVKRPDPPESGDKPSPDPVPVTVMELTVPVRETETPPQKPKNGPPMVPVPGSEETVKPKPVQEPVKVTPEVYRNTFTQIENLILELNAIIQRGDYAKWLNYLTDEYKRTYNNQAVLASLSETPTLKEKDIRLRTLFDYFQYVVVPSRMRSLLNRIIFLDPDHLQAVTIVQEVPVILYSLRRENAVWKISVE